MDITSEQLHMWDMDSLLDFRLSYEHETLSDLRQK
jgi:hypothetical protein